MELGAFDIECPECQAKLTVSTEDVAKERSVTCPKGHSIRLMDEGGKIADAQQALDDFEHNLKNLGGS